MSEKTWPKPLAEASGPMRRDKLDGAAEGMGDHGSATVELHGQNIVPVDMMTGLTLYILGHQPKDPAKQKIPGAGGGVAGGVWVRERFTVIRPVDADDVFKVTGEAIGRHVHKGRRYGSNRCETFNAAGEPVARNLTTGLLAYQVEEGLKDQLEGENPDLIEAPGPDSSCVADNPHLDALRELKVGDELTSEPFCLSLAMMEARDTKKPDNPIHSDPELAKKAGLKKPIAGGSHVLAFPLELIMARCGARALHYGAAFDVRWKTPVYADLNIVPRARVIEATESLLTFETDVTLDDGAVAMVATVRVPLA